MCLCKQLAFSFYSLLASTFTSGIVLAFFAYLFKPSQGYGSFSFPEPNNKIIFSNNIMDQPKCSSAMVDHNNNGTEGGFPGFPTIINTSSMPSPSVNFMFPSAQVYIIRSLCFLSSSCKFTIYYATTNMSPLEFTLQ